MKNKPTKPATILELINRAERISGYNIKQLADIAETQLPKSLSNNKGFIGQLIEWHLGADAGSKPTPDFEELGIELKTLPIDTNGNPLETTFVCMAQLINNTPLTWSNSPVKKKLNKILWIPIIVGKQAHFFERIVGNPLIWTLEGKKERILKNDWEEITEMISLGMVTELTAHRGQYLQLRPKAANSNIKTKAIDQEGNIVMVNPRGYYLRKNFTKEIFSEMIT
ncbi:DNA mismatch repair endonuclease MutH [Paraphotobacterium marinum]|uniref:DNA mismatch repair protein MutH n=1 Tax=Paraphotobacterium marinum TaxID=1755811 RepID=A0A220VEK7_9GAMM|nr:DNA mismatch repair endonuclease MutH [Paraphotobacterium marinum]ASK78353.1 DNA mismatch repair endonuclease MutH [Paraphotobacterium marinum]